MTPEQKKELEEDLLSFVKRVCRAKPGLQNYSPEEAAALPEIAKLLLNFAVYAPKGQ